MSLVANTGSWSPQDWGRVTFEILDNIRKNNPRVHCITNEVAVAYSANALLAVGAIPSMTWQAQEVGDFVTSAQALVINLGTLDPDRESGMRTAIAHARDQSIPWILDPVFIERSPGRLARARDLLGLGPAIVRGNGAEHAVLKAPATQVQVCSGPVDVVAHQQQHVSIHNGHPMMAQVTATGCAATALLGACRAVHDDSFISSVAATLILGVAGEIAAGNAAGPGTLQTTLLDALSNLTEQDLLTRSRIE